VLGNENEVPFADLNIFPNPAQTETIIESDALARSNSQLVVTDAYGRNFDTNPTRLSRTQVRINVSGMASGKYFVKVDTGAEPLVKALMVMR
jgi:hypothetical protein